MNLFNNLLTTLKKRFKRKPDLRTLVVMEYGEDFGIVYDELNRGGVIGGFSATISFLNAIEKVKHKYDL